MASGDFFRTIEREAAKFTPADEPFSLWVDRQKRPTVGATVQGDIGSSRKKIGNELFLKMIRSLSELLGRTEKPYLTYHVGKWQRQKRLAIKAHLPTETFLSLIDDICEDAGIRHNVFDSVDVKRDMERREKHDYHYPKIEELYAMGGDHFRFLSPETVGGHGFRPFITRRVRYPVVLLCNDADKATSISIENLPKALNVLDGLASTEWKVQGYAIAMLGQKRGNAFKLAAVFDEKDFAERTDHDVAALRENWGWQEPSREYHGRHGPSRREREREL
eukprot:m.18141 g.18141  ORF g.18141 m.18141 type:complete len:277 (+) comp27605_c0_seq1:34-864(+)